MTWVLTTVNKTLCYRGGMDIMLDAWGFIFNFLWLNNTAASLITSYFLTWTNFPSPILSIKLIKTSASHQHSSQFQYQIHLVVNKSNRDKFVQNKYKCYYWCVYLASPPSCKTWDVSNQKLIGSLSLSLSPGTWWGGREVWVWGNLTEQSENERLFGKWRNCN